MSLLYAGIDEAGFGPMLGPLVVGMALFEVRDWNPGQPAPDLWDRLGVSRSLRGAGDRIPIADSKKLKLPNTTKKHHPCVHLERAVLASLVAGGLAGGGGGIGDDTELLAALGADLPRHPWYRGDPIPLPLEGNPEKGRIDANILARAFDRSGVRLASLRVRIIPAPEFNEIIRATGSKSETTAGPVAGFLREAADLSGGDGPVRVVCDRQSGRLDYENIIARAFPGEPVALDVRTHRASRYLVRDGRVALHFETEAEDRHLPVALASMAAKLVRELMMARFNRFFAARCPGVRPTAGYVLDARRWLDDTRDTLDDDQRRKIIRIA